MGATADATGRCGEPRRRNTARVRSALLCGRTRRKVQRLPRVARCANCCPSEKGNGVSLISPPPFPLFPPLPLASPTFFVRWVTGPISTSGGTPTHWAHTVDRLHVRLRLPVPLHTQLATAIQAILTRFLSGWLLKTSMIYRILGTYGKVYGGEVV